MRALTRMLAGSVTAASLCLAAPAFAASAPAASVQPWVLMSAFASPAASKELCKESDRSAEKSATEDERDPDHGCALPIQGTAAAGYGSAGAGALTASPLFAGLVALAEIAAFVALKGDS